jgi:hypothetical protein
MENQHRQITGYRELTLAEIELMNEIKAMGVHLQALCNKVDQHVLSQRLAATEQEHLRLNAADAEKWYRWARDGFQADLMHLVRAVAQPTTY